MNSRIQLPIILATLADLSVAAYGGTTEVPITPAPRSNQAAHWELQAGFGIRQSFDFSTGIAGSRAPGSNTVPSSLLGAIGATNADANRAYDDGFVNVGSAVGLTTNWGYQSASQVRPSSQSWGPEGTDSLYLSRSSPAGLGEFRNTESSGPEIFPYLELSRLWTLEKLNSEVGFTLGFSTVSAEAAASRYIPSYRTNVVDEYYLYGVIPPAAPYSGPELPPGPILDNRPTNREVTQSTDAGTAMASTNSELSLYTFSAGGVWRWTPGKGSFLSRMRLYGTDLQAGVTLNRSKLTLDHVSQSFNGSSYTTVDSGSASESDFQPGFYISMDANFELSPDELYFTITGRYDDAGKIEARTADSWSDVDLAGWSMQFGLTKRW